MTHQHPKERFQEYQETVGRRPGGNQLASLLSGVILFFIGVFLILQNTVLYTRFTFGDLLGFTPPFGLVLLPLLIGIGILFFNEKSWLGWGLTVLGIITILLGILMGLRIAFKPITLYQGILMYGMTSAGLGLMLKGLIGKRR